MRQTSVGGGTKYAPVMEEIIRRSQNDVKEIKQKGLLKKMFGKKSFEIVPKEYPTFVFFITDGDNFDRQQTNEVITEAARQGIFWQFVGIGNPTDGFTYLEHLDELEGRYIDNANFFSVNDILSISDSELYDRLLNEFPIWLKEAKVKGLIL
ncbi:VWA domain-containing protein [Bacillus stercoris]|nr:VWA domain-containing protein [Bacillus stercoris]